MVLKLPPLTRAQQPFTISLPLLRQTRFRRFSLPILATLVEHLLVGKPVSVATAPSYPFQTGALLFLSLPTLRTDRMEAGKEKLEKERGRSFDMFKSWGNLSPWYSVKRGAFGVDSGPEAPQGCRVNGLHFLHRHGARYPTAWCAFHYIALEALLK